jgi:peptidoglycan/LPS O-acetylase OafA/YrhL
MIFKNFMTNKTALKLGANTLSIYVIHFVILYGSFTGLGLYQFYHHQLTPIAAILGAIAFMFVCTFLALRYAKYEVEIKSQISRAFSYLKLELHSSYKSSMPKIKYYLSQTRIYVTRFLKTVRG